MNQSKINLKKELAYYKNEVELYKKFINHLKLILEENSSSEDCLCEIGESFLYEYEWFDANRKKVGDDQ